MTTWSYVGSKPCGCIMAAVVDDPEFRKEVARMVKDWIEMGLVVTRADSEIVKADYAVDECTHRTRQLELRSEGQ